ncbi:MAG: fibrillarin-like rRNA/tRNA 2'-O-methyltransferase [Candidatus Aenigmatarchaeota archaeon]
MKAKKHEKFDGIFLIDGKLATLNLLPGEKVYGEELVRIGENEYRVWDVWRSKPAAAIKKGVREFPIKKGLKILYLGIASGTTASHLSDIVGKEGIIYGVEFSERVLRELISHAEKRGNIVPILADARKPEEYRDIVIEKIDVVYCDVASPDEIELFIRNCLEFLKPKGYGMIAIKSRSIDVLKKPEEIYKETRKKLEERFEILDFVKLDPYDKDHGFFVVKLK